MTFEIDFSKIKPEIGRQEPMTPEEEAFERQQYIEWLDLQAQIEPNGPLKDYPL